MLRRVSTRKRVLTFQILSLDRYAEGELELHTLHGAIFNGGLYHHLCFFKDLSGSFAGVIAEPIGILL